MRKLGMTFIYNTLLWPLATSSNLEEELYKNSPSKVEGVPFSVRWDERSEMKDEMTDI